MRKAPPWQVPPHTVQAFPFSRTGSVTANVVPFGPVVRRCDSPAMARYDQAGDVKPQAAAVRLGLLALLPVKAGKDLAQRLILDSHPGIGYGQHRFPIGHLRGNPDAVSRFGILQRVFQQDGQKLGEQLTIGLDIQTVLKRTRHRLARRFGLVAKRLDKIPHHLIQMDVFPVDVISAA